MTVSPDFAEPLVMPGYGGAASAGGSVFGATGLDNQPPEEVVAIITSMGFHRNQAVQALRATVSTRDCGCGYLPLTGVLCISASRNGDFPMSFGHFRSCLFHSIPYYGPQRFICIQYI